MSDFEANLIYCPKIKLLTLLELNTNALIAVHPSHLNKLLENRIASKNDIQLIKTKLKTNPAVLYSLQRSPSAMTYVIATDKVEKVVKLIEALGEHESGFLGFFEKKLE